MSKQFTTYIIIVLGLCGCEDRTYCEQPMTSLTIERTKRSGERIADALDRYYQDQGHYPDVLSSLVPSYLESIEPPVAGVPVWFYRTTEGGQNYELEFGSLMVTSQNPFPSYAISGDYKEWVVDD